MMKNDELFYYFVIEVVTCDNLNYVTTFFVSESHKTKTNEGMIQSSSNGGDRPRLWHSIPKEAWFTSSALQYKEERKVGEGTYGEVFLGSNLLTKEIVALKKVSLKYSDEKYRKRGLPLNALREIRLLKNKCEHPHVVKLFDVAAFIPAVSRENNKKIDDEDWDNDGDSFVYLVFEYVEHDLSGILESKHRFNISAIKCLMKQLLEALSYLHTTQNVCHRDLKCSNLLISKNHELKLADFGLARELYSTEYGGDFRRREYSINVITLWYRPPELLLGDKRYTHSVDMWSVGCILVELLKNEPMFPGSDELDQLKKIFSICGYPNEVDWPEYINLPNTKKMILSRNRPDQTGFNQLSVTNVQNYCQQKNFDYDASSLAARMLALDPSKRVTAEQALKSTFLANAPQPNELPPIPANKSLHEWETKKERRARQKEKETKQQQQNQNKEPKSTTPTNNKIPSLLDIKPIVAPSKKEPSEKEEGEIISNKDDSLERVQNPSSSGKYVSPLIESDRYDQEKKKPRLSPDTRRDYYSKSTNRNDYSADDYHRSDYYSRRRSIDRDDYTSSRRKDDYEKGSYRDKDDYYSKEDYSRSSAQDRRDDYPSRYSDNKFHDRDNKSSRIEDSKSYRNDVRSSRLDDYRSKEDDLYKSRRDEKKKPDEGILATLVPIVSSRDEKEYRKEIRESDSNKYSSKSREYTSKDNARYQDKHSYRDSDYRSRRSRSRRRRKN